MNVPGTSNQPIYATVSIAYKGEKRKASIYEDGTAIFENGEQILLTDLQMKKVRQKKEEAIALAQAKARNALERQRRESEAVPLRNVPQADADPYDEPDEPDSWQDPGDGHEPKRGIRNVLITVMYVGVFIGTVIGAGYLLDNHMKQIEVAQFSSEMPKDSQITAENLTKLQLSESNYRQLTDTSDGGLVLWQDAQGIIGKYMLIDALKGQILTYDYVTDTRVVENPWINSLSQDAQLYSIQFDPYSTYNQSLFSGSHVRMKAVVNELNEKGQVTGTAVQTISGAAMGAILDDPAEAEGVTDDTSELQVPVTVVEDGDNTQAYIGSLDENLSDATPDRFADIIVVDVINAANESLFDVYLSLSRMTYEARREYLTSRASSAGANEYKSRFVPMSLVFALDDDQVSELTKVENMSNATITYTVLPMGSYDATDEQRTLLLKFAEVQKDITEIFGEVIGQNAGQR